MEIEFDLGLGEIAPLLLERGVIERLNPAANNLCPNHCEVKSRLHLFIRLA
jgi:hypothetical protein